MDERTGEVLAAAVLAERVGWAAGLVSVMAADLLARHWNCADVDVLASGEDAGGRALPSNAWMALRRLGWTTAPAGGVKANDRIVRMAQEQAGRVLRAAKWRADLTAGVLTTWPGAPDRRTAEEWAAVRGAVPGGQFLPSNVIKSRTRQVTAFVRMTGRMPLDVFELEATPRIARMLLLSACDGQQATIERTDEPGRALLRLQLPTRPDPASYKDWTWVACPITLPPTVPAGAVVHLPTLRVNGGQVRADLAYTHAVPRTRRTGHTIALGVDWGLNTLLSVGAARLHDDGQITALGSGGQFRAAGILARQHRLRRLSEHLHTKADHYERLTAGDEQHALTGRHHILRDEIRHVCDRRAHLNDALAWAAARWTVDQAITASATVIYVEDLRSMEAKGMGRTLNTRLSQQVRGQIVVRMRHLAAEVGIAVVTVPARNTSKHCPQCLTPLRHRKAPDRPTTPGWKWALCPSCLWQGDRDHGAWRRIAARGLTHQTKTVTDRARGAMVIRAVVDKLETRAVITPSADKTSRNDRSKTGPTRPRATRPTPRRRRTPSPTRPTGPAGKRPEGHAHTDRTRLPRAAHRHQGVTTISTPTNRHQPRGAALGAGFHLHAHATPPRWAIPLPDTTSDMGSLSWLETLRRAGGTRSGPTSPGRTRRPSTSTGCRPCCRTWRRCRASGG
ncbi:MULTISPECIES: zinc ribbon domain-containing protein [unclassified Streptomyces]|uniref:zinc ribbon domain-containing protein n=1 Tax=unclassified Streptomyces TaxID=2593676 RepID=UPI002DD8F129|nr:zinc ribbon domain-containing protein [Streptomyces sp. NBC_01445]WSE05570.1 zinc ribbon domain-containing protein [Streptomyces sp. NBC_01445]